MPIQQFNPQGLNPSAWNRPAANSSQNFSSMMGMMNQLVMTQFMALMMQMTQMIAGMGAASGGAPGFGQGGSSSPGIGNFLGGSSGSSGSSGSGAAGAPAAGAVDAGGGWTNPVGGSYKVSGGFGPRKAPTAGASTNHQAVDMAGAANTPILAAKGGTVSISKDESGGLGKWIEIKHDDGTKSRYGHMNERMVQEGARVTGGQQIGKMGTTGISTGNHLHFEVFNAQGAKVDPAKLMKL